MKKKKTVKNEGGLGLFFSFFFLSFCFFKPNYDYYPREATGLIENGKINGRATVSLKIY